MKQIITIPKGIKYISVELIDKKASSNSCDIITGLFKGIATLKNNNIIQSFILLSGRKEDTVEIYNITYYNVMSLVVLGEDTKASTYFTISDEDQRSAQEGLENLVDELVKESRMLEFDPDIIDITTYSDIPDEINKTCKIPYKNNIGFNSNQISNNNSTPYVQKVPEPTVIKRTKTKKPTKKELSILLEKIKAIRDGSFTMTLPETKGGIYDKNATAAAYTNFM